MSLDKTEIKIGTVHEIGCRLDDMLEASQKDVHRMDGAVQALRKAEESVQALGALADKEMDEGKFDLEQAHILKRYIERAVQVLTNLRLQAQNNHLTSIGRVQGMEAAVTAAKKIKDEEERKRAAILAALAAGRAHQEAGQVVVDEGDRAVGIRPGGTIKERRLAEEAAEREAVSKAASEPVHEPPPAAPIPKKRGRPRKAR